MVRGRPFQKGRPKPPGSGRKKGTPNKATRAVKEFLSQLMDDPQVQARLRQRIMEGDTWAFLRAVEHVIGKPRQSVEQRVAGPVVFSWQDDRIVERLKKGRERAADAARVAPDA
jgi:hypothetical protein